MKNFNNKIKLMFIMIISVISFVTIFYFSNMPKKNNTTFQQADLIIYTPLSDNLYLPIIKEFQERNDVSIEIYVENEEDMITKLKDPSSFNGDILLGILNDSVEENKALFSNHSALNSIPFVIAFNNYLLTSHEKIVSYECLTKPDFKGKIGFVNPHSSAVYDKILTIMAAGSDDPQLFKELFIANTKDYYFGSTEDINWALKNGTISIGITTEQSAVELARQSANINYLNKYDCVIGFEIALPKKSKEKELAINLFEFVNHKDTTQFISSYLNSNLGDRTYELD